MEYGFTSSTSCLAYLRACGSCRKSDHVEAVSATSTLELNSNTDFGRRKDNDLLLAYLESHNVLGSLFQPRFWFRFFLAQDTLVQLAHI